jgi:glycosyltransferase involved in cell wall biosynthesis
MKKILIFNGYYYPSKNCGGPITSIENIVNGCCDEFDFYIICYNHDFNDSTKFDVDINKWIQIGNAKVMYVEPGYLDYSLRRTKILYEELKPDLIWFSGVLTPNNKIVTVINARKLNIPVIFSPRGEVSADRVKLKGYKKIPYLTLLKITGMYRECYFHGTSDDEEAGIRKYFDPDKDHIFRVANIAIMQQPEVIQNRKQEGEIKLFFFSRIHEVKNLLFAIQVVNKCKAKVVFDIYGPIESIDYWKQCEQEIAKSPDNVKIKYCGILQHRDMSTVIQGYDAFLFPTINENYGHVIAEALANSRPVILSKGTTPWDDLDGRAGFAIDLNNDKLFVEKLELLAKFNEAEYKKLIDSTKEYFSEKMGKDLAIIGHKKMINDILENR